MVLVDSYSKKKIGQWNYALSLVSCEHPEHEGEKNRMIRRSDARLGKGVKFCIKCVTKGENNPFFNKTHTKETIDKIRLKNTDPSITPEYRAERRFGKELVEWARKVKEKFNFTCDICERRGGRLESHHIFNYKDHPKGRTDIRNGVCLCEKCHEFFHKIFGRRHNNFIQYEEFKEVMICYIQRSQ